MSSALHRKLQQRALREGHSLNTLCERFLQQGLQQQASSAWDSIKAQLLPLLRRYFGADLEGIVVFGSRVRGEAHAGSDLDVLVVLHQRHPVTRALYRWWDAHVPTSPTYEINPHFVHLPAGSGKASGLWLEVALAHEILFEHGALITDTIRQLLRTIEHGNFERAWTHGHPYWIRRTHAE